MPDATSPDPDLPLIPAGAAFVPVAIARPTRGWVFCLTPGFTLLAFSSAVEPLRIANQLSQRPLYRWHVASAEGGAVESSAGIPVQTEALAAVLDRDATLMICGGNRPAEVAAPRVIAALGRHRRFGGTVGGICTGAYALARAGLLEGRRFTLHWENQPGFHETFPSLTPTGNRFEVDGPLMTCGGGAASTDLMLSVIAQDYGSEFATMVAEMCLRSVTAGENAAQRSSLAALMASRTPALVSTVRAMSEHLEDPLPMEAIARIAGYSRRHLERLFTTALGEPPARFYQGLRLDHARNLLTSTDAPLIEISTACGFATVAHFSRRFRLRFGVAPTRLRVGRGAQPRRP